MKRICIVTTVPETISIFLKNHIKVISQFYDVTVITNIDHNFEMNLPSKINLIPLEINRNIDLLTDLKSLFILKKIFNKEKFDLVISVTPKAGLLASLASCLSGIKIKLHWFTGQVWSSKHGFKRFFLKNIDKLIVSCVTHVLIDSQSQFNFLMSEKVLDSKKGNVLGKGSISGVDLNYFKFNSDIKKTFRKKIGLNEFDNVIIFLGRLNRDKGIFDLVESFNLIVNEVKNLHLVLVGPDEQKVKEVLFKSKKLHPNIHFIGRTLEPQKWLCVGDIFCLPSYREGFGTSVIEAAAIGIPSITSRIYGLRDTVIEGQTGVTHQVGNIIEIANAIKLLINDKKLRYNLGNNAKKRVESYFSQPYISELFLEFINKIFSDKKHFIKINKI